MSSKGGFKGAGKAGGTGGKFDQEDRSRDWYCPKCQERNFMKRNECHKCGAERPKDGGGQPPALPSNGATLNGMVKSYNRKGFGFIMCLDGSPQCQDIYYSRENLHTSLQTRDIPGEHVTFEIQRFPDGKLVAKNVRPVGEPENYSRSQPQPPTRSSAPARMAPKGGTADQEDRSRDWICESCGTRNFVKRFECFKCGAKRPASLDMDDGPGPAPRRTFSPHAGARAIKEQMIAAAGKRGRSASGSDKSSSSSSRSRKKKKKRKKRRSSSSSSSKSSKSSKSSAKEEADAAGESSDVKNPEVEKAKAEILQKLMKLKEVNPMAARMKEYRELLRQWHPDKNPDKVEVATAVFQFLQKAKPMIAPKED